MSCLNTRKTVLSEKKQIDPQAYGLGKIRLSPLFHLSAIFVFSTLFLLTPWIHGNDGAGYYAPVRSIIVDGDFDLENEYIYFSRSREVASLRLDAHTQKYYSQYPFGTSMLWLPAVSTAHFISKITGKPVNGYTRLYYWFVCLTSALLAFWALISGYKFLRKRYGLESAYWSVLGVWLGTSLFYYMFFESSMSHAFSFALITFFILHFYRIWGNANTGYGVWFLGGLLLGIIAIIRLQDLLTGLLPLGILMYYFINQRLNFFSFLRVGGIFLSGFILGILPDLIVNTIDHGTPLAYGTAIYTGSFAADQWWYALKVMFSANHGIFFWSPLAFLAILGLLIKRAFFTNLLLAVFFSQVILTGFWYAWNGAQSFGHRFFVGYTFIFVLGITALFDICQNNRKLLKFLISGLVLLNVMLMVQYGLRMIETEGPLDLLVFFENFKTIPDILADVVKFILSKEEFIE